jgi:MYXO-CTERM domain-containing protein
VSGVFPDANDLNVEGPGAIVYLRFPATAGAAQNAMLTLRTHATSNASGGSGRICAVADSTWSETGLTWANKPVTGTCVGTSVHVGSDTEVQWDVTSLVQAGRATNLAIVSTDPDGAHFISREAGGGATGPRLRVVELPPQPDAGAGPVLDAGVPPVVDAGVDAGTPSPADGGTVGTPVDHGPNPFVPGDVSGVGGCGCQSGGELTLLLSAVALFVRRRRAR